MDAKKSDDTDGNEDATEDYFRIIIEGQDDGIEHRGWRGITRTRAADIAAYIDRKGVAEEMIGRLPKRTNITPFAYGRGYGRGRK